MKYFWLENAFEKKDTGMSNAARQAALDKRHFANVDNYNFYANYMYGEGRMERVYKLPERGFNLEGVMMHPKSKLTDFISCCDVNWGMIISDRVVATLSGCVLPAHQLYPVIVHHQGQKYENYRYLFFEALGAEYVDFEKSAFYVGDLVEERKFRSIRLINAEDYREKEKQLHPKSKAIYPEHLVFNGRFNPQWDWFSMKEMDYRNYISERLLEVFKQHKITGFYAMPLPGFTMEVPEVLQTVE